MADRSDPYAATRSSLDEIVVRAGSFDEAIPRVLECVCRTLRWDVGQWWLLDEATNALTRGGSWRPPEEPQLEIERLSARSTFHAGVGLPGRVVASGEPAWIRDVQRDLSFPRASAAAQDGLSSGFGIPISSERRQLGMIEFFSREAREENVELCRMLTPVGEELGRLLVTPGG